MSSPGYQQILCALFPLHCLVMAPGVAADTAGTAYDATVKSPAGDVGGRLALGTAIETSGPVPLGGYTGLLATGAFCAAAYVLTLKLAR